MSDSQPPLRSAEYEVPIDAPAADVWAALTDPRELERWFPLRARVAPGVGGAIDLRWGEGEGESWPIITWEPLRRLTIGMAKPAGAPSPSHVLTDFVIEDSGSTTMLRVVASGFDSDAEWDSFYHGIRRGWRFELRGLRHYLERHRGEDRSVAWARCRFDGSYDAMWSALFGTDGWTPSGRLEAARDGDHYRIAAPDGTTISGTVCIVEHPKDFTGTIDELNDAVLRVQLEPAPSGNQVGVWVAAYGVAPERMQALAASWQRALTALTERNAVEELAT